MASSARLLQFFSKVVRYTHQYCGSHYHLVGVEFVGKVRFSIQRKHPRPYG